MFEKWKERRRIRRLVIEEQDIAVRLYILRDRYDNRRAGVRESEKDRPDKDFMTPKEGREYSSLARRHNEICSELGKSSEFFRPKIHGQGADEDSPIAFLQVERDASEKVDINADDYSYPGGREAFIEHWTRDEEFEAAFKEWRKQQERAWGVTSEERQQQLTNKETSD